MNRIIKMKSKYELFLQDNSKNNDLKDEDDVFFPTQVEKYLNVKIYN